jgi:hypothetical protein
VKMQTEVHGTTKIPENTLLQSKVRCARGMHVKADLLDSIGDGRTRQSKIL